MVASQRPAGRSMVKRSLVGPGSHVVTLRTIGDWEARRIVNWISGPLVGVQVAARVPAIVRLNA